MYYLTTGTDPAILKWGGGEGVLVRIENLVTYHNLNKTLGRARDPRANGTWLNKITE